MAGHVAGGLGTKPPCKARSARVSASPHMANRSVWTVRQKHEWMATPLKGKHLKKRKRVRIGLEAALARKAKPDAGTEQTS